MSGYKSTIFGKNVTVAGNQLSGSGYTISGVASGIAATAFNSAVDKSIVDKLKKSLKPDFKVSGKGSVLDVERLSFKANIVLSQQYYTNQLTMTVYPIVDKGLEEFTKSESQNFKDCVVKLEDAGRTAGLDYIYSSANVLPAVVAKDYKINTTNGPVLTNIDSLQQLVVASLTYLSKTYDLEGPSPAQVIKAHLNMQTAAKSEICVEDLLNVPHPLYPEIPLFLETLMSSKFAGITNGIWLYKRLSA